MPSEGTAPAVSSHLAGDRESDPEATSTPPPLTVAEELLPGSRPPSAIFWPGEVQRTGAAKWHCRGVCHPKEAEITEQGFVVLVDALLCSPRLPLPLPREFSSPMPAHGGDAPMETLFTLPELTRRIPPAKICDARDWTRTDNVDDDGRAFNG